MGAGRSPELSRGRRLPTLLAALSPSRERESLRSSASTSEAGHARVVVRRAIEDLRCVTDRTTDREHARSRARERRSSTATSLKAGERQGSTLTER